MERKLSRRDFLKLAAVATGAAALAACGVKPNEQPLRAVYDPNEKVIGYVDSQGVLHLNNAAVTQGAGGETPTPRPTRIITMIGGKGEKDKENEVQMVALPDSWLAIPSSELANPQEYLEKLIRAGRPNEGNFSLSIINQPGVVQPQREAPLLWGKAEWGNQGVHAMPLQPRSKEVRGVSGGQFIIPITDKEAPRLPDILTVKDVEATTGKPFNHIVFERVRLNDNSWGIKIPGGTPGQDGSDFGVGDNYYRGNILLVLASTKTANNACHIQGDAGSTWQIQYAVADSPAETPEGGIRADLLTYVLYNPDAQRTEGHGLSAMESIYRGKNCAGKGCRTYDDDRNLIAAQAGIGVYVFQITPDGLRFNLLAGTVLTPTDLQLIFRR